MNPLEKLLNDGYSIEGTFAWKTVQGTEQQGTKSVNVETHAPALVLRKANDVKMAIWTPKGWQLMEA